MQVVNPCTAPMLKSLRGPNERSAGDSYTLLVVDCSASQLSNDRLGIERRTVHERKF